MAGVVDNVEVEALGLPRSIAQVDTCHLLKLDVVPPLARRAQQRAGAPKLDDQTTVAPQERLHASDGVLVLAQRPSVGVLAQNNVRG
jgi:hypothetical protein